MKPQEEQTCAGCDWAEPVGDVIRCVCLPWRLIPKDKAEKGREPDCPLKDFQ